MNVVVPPADVELGEDFLPLQLFKYGADEGEWIGVLYSPGVEGSVIHDGLQFPILFLPKEE